MKRLTIYWATGCDACEEALEHLARWAVGHGAEVIIDKRNVGACDWKLPGDRELRVTPTYVLTDYRGNVISEHEGVMSSSELSRFTKKELAA